MVIYKPISPINPKPFSAVVYVFMSMSCSLSDTCLQVIRIIIICINISMNSSMWVCIMLWFIALSKRKRKTDSSSAVWWIKVFRQVLKSSYSVSRFFFFFPAWADGNPSAAGCRVITDCCAASGNYCCCSPLLLYPSHVDSGLQQGWRGHTSGETRLFHFHLHLFFCRLSPLWEQV